MRPFASMILLGAFVLAPQLTWAAVYPVGRHAVPAYAVQIKELRATKLLLEKADHDYQGHRAKAVHNITMAIHQLEMGKKYTSKIGKHEPKSGSHEPQSVSDAQLRTAITNLNTIVIQLQASTTTRALHARNDIQHAIKELNVALAIK